MASSFLTSIPLAHRNQSISKREDRAPASSQHPLGRPLQVMREVTATATFYMRTSHEPKSYTHSYGCVSELHGAEEGIERGVEFGKFVG